VNGITLKALSENSFWKKYNKFSIWALIIAGLTTITILAGLPAIKKMLFEPLPTWEVNDPVSKVFVMDEVPTTTGSLAAGDSTVQNEYLVDPAIDTLLLLMEAQGVYFHKTGSRPSGIVGSNDVVILKGNFQWSGRSTTNTDRIKGLIWQILQHPDGFTGEILVGDNTQHTSIDKDDNNSEDQDQCIIDVINTFYAKGYPVYLMNWTDITHNVVTEYSDGDYNDGFTYDPASKISYPKFQSPMGSYVSASYGIWDSVSQTYDLDRLCMINVPVPKTHGYSGATIALKNWIGVFTIHDFDERFGSGHAMHYDYFFSEFALVAKLMMATFPKLTIVDAEWTNPNGNQLPNSSVQTKMLLGSTDPLAASWYTAKYILAPISSNSIDPDNPNGRYHEVITNWANCFYDSGFAVTMNASEMSVYDRAELHNITANIKAFLEGPYNGSGAMTTTLNDNNFIPLNSDSAYPMAVYNYTPSTVDSIPNSDIVDWVLIELRTGTASDSIVGTRAAFIKNDGTIIDTDGLSPVTFTGLSDGNYYVVVRHRNHLAIMSDSSISLSGSSALYDFCTSQSKAYTTGTDPMIDLGGGVYGMYSGDTNISGIVTAGDKSMVNSYNLSIGYYNADTNLSGIVTAADKTNINFNNLKQEFVP